MLDVVEEGVVVDVVIMLDVAVNVCCLRWVTRCLGAMSPLMTSMCRVQVVVLLVEDELAAEEAVDEAPILQLVVLDDDVEVDEVEVADVVDNGLVPEVLGDVLEVDVELVPVEMPS